MPSHRFGSVSGGNIKGPQMTDLAHSVREVIATPSIHVRVVGLSPSFARMGTSGGTYVRFLVFTQTHTHTHTTYTHTHIQNTDTFNTDTFIHTHIQNTSTYIHTHLHNSSLVAFI